MTLSRRYALTTMAGTIALTATPFGALRAQTAPNGTLRVAVLSIFDVAPCFAALAQGYFTDEHLTVTTTNVSGGGAAMIPALAGGDFDIAYSNAPSVALAVARGINLRIIVGSPPITAPPATVALVKRAGDPISTGKDLEGKALAVNALGNVQWMVARAWVKATGGDPDKVNYLEIPIPAMTDALTANRFAAAMLIDPFLTIALGQPQKYAILSWAFSEVYANAPIAFWVCTDQLVQTKAPLVQAFVRGYRRGVVWVNANRGKEPLIDLLASYTNVQPDLIRKLTIPPASATIDPAHFGIMLNMMRENKLLPKNINLAAQVYNVS
jgi:NitT/TauT family transport system substrate-binding protein